MIQKKYIFSFVLFVTVMLSVNVSVLAYQGQGYFLNKTTCTTDSKFNQLKCDEPFASISQNDVISGSTIGGGQAVNVAIGADQPTNKANFIAWLSGELNGADARDRLGAQFIVSTMVGSVDLNLLNARLSNPSINLRIVNEDPNKFGNGQISFSGKNTSGNRDVFFTDYDVATPRSLILFESSGGVLYVLEVRCANPVGGLPGLPDYTPKSADLSAFAGPNGSVTLSPNSDNTGYNIATYNDFKLGVNVANVSPPDNNDTYNWKIEKNVNNTGWADITAGSSNIKNKYEASYSESTNIPKRICYRIIITSAPNYANVNPASAEQCVNFNGPGIVVTTAEPEVTDYEKGSGENTVKFILKGQKPCGFDANKVTIKWEAFNDTVKLDAYNTDVQPDRDPSDGCGDYVVLDTRTHTIQGSDLDNQSVGNYGKFIARIISPFSYVSSPRSFLIYEVPYAQFKGNDFIVCGDGLNNRFVWDNRSVLGTGIGSESSGSYGEYATIFKYPNTPDSGFSGLNSFKGISRNYLETWGSYACNPPLVDNGVSNGDLHQKITGNYYINKDINYGNEENTKPEDYKVAIIYAKKDGDKGGNIYIKNTVNYINAILIAEGDIYTCAKDGASNTAVLVPQLDYELTSDKGGCNNSLKIDGAISANNVHLMRTGGTRYLSNGVKPAEVINYPWQLHHATSALTKSYLEDIDSLLDLPPRL